MTAPEELRRGIALLWLGDDVAALGHLARSAAELPPAARAESQYRIGAVYARRGEYARAAPFFSEALAAAGGGELRQRAGYALAVTHFNTGAYAAALEVLEQVTAGAAGRWLAAGRLAQAAALYRLGRPREAAEYFGLAAAAYAGPRRPDPEPAAPAAEGGCRRGRGGAKLAGAGAVSRRRLGAGARPVPRTGGGAGGSRGGTGLALVPRGTGLGAAAGPGRG